MIQLLFSGGVFKYGAFNEIFREIIGNYMYCLIKTGGKQLDDEGIKLVKDDPVTIKYLMR